MQVIISGGTKARKLKGNFKVYGSKKELRAIAKQIMDNTVDPFDVGWIDITDETPTDVPVEEWEM